MRRTRKQLPTLRRTTVRGVKQVLTQEGISYADLTFTQHSSPAVRFYGGKYDGLTLPTTHVVITGDEDKLHQLFLPLANRGMTLSPCGNTLSVHWPY